MIDVRDGIFPTTVIDNEEEKDVPEALRNELEEERRLFYVGVTRAKNKLEIFDYEAIYGEKCETALFLRQLLGIQKNAKLRERAEKSKNDHTALSEKRIKPAREKAMSGQEITRLLSQYKTGMKVEHKTYGKGIIDELKPPICRILIDGGEIRSFDIVYCISNRLISICK